MAFVFDFCRCGAFRATLPNLWDGSRDCESQFYQEDALPRNFTLIRSDRLKVAICCAASFGALAAGASAASAQTDSFGTTVSFVSNSGYDASTAEIELGILVTIDELSSDGMVAMQPGTNLPFNDFDLTINGRNVDDASCDQMSVTQFNCAYSYVLTQAERNSQSLTFSGAFVFAHAYHSTGGGQTSFYYNSDGSNIRSSDLTIQPNGPNPFCTTETQPLLPTSLSQGAFMFAISPSDICNGTFFIDPPIATGYDFSLVGGAFEKITAPTAQTVPDPNGYQVTFPNSSVPPVTLMPGQSHVLTSYVREFNVRGIDAALQLNPSDQTAFPMGVDIVPDNNGPIVILQKPVSPPPTSPPAAPVYGLGGDEVTVIQENNPGSAVSAVVSPALEFFNLRTRNASGVNYGPPRWDIDVDADRIRITFIQSGGPASYGATFYLGFTDLNPSVPTCNGRGEPIVIGATTTTNRGDVPFTVAGTQFSTNRLDVPIGPPQTQAGSTYDWNNGDWIDVQLTYGCAPPPRPWDPLRPPPQAPQTGQDTGRPASNPAGSLGDALKRLKPKKPKNR